jgi:hypothetical protein
MTPPGIVANLTLLPHVTNRENSAKPLPNRHLEIAEMLDKFSLQNQPSEENCPCGEHLPLSCAAAWLRCR